MLFLFATAGDRTEIPNNRLRVRDKWLISVDLKCEDDTVQLVRQCLQIQNPVICRCLYLFTCLFSLVRVDLLVFKYRLPFTAPHGFSCWFNVFNVNQMLAGVVSTSPQPRFSHIVRDILVSIYRPLRFLVFAPWFGFPNSGLICLPCLSTWFSLTVQGFNSWPGFILSFFPILPRLLSIGIVFTVEQ